MSREHSCTRLVLILLLAATSARAGGTRVTLNGTSRWYQDGLHSLLSVPQPGPSAGVIPAADWTQLPPAPPGPPPMPATTLFSRRRAREPAGLDLTGALAREPRAPGGGGGGGGNIALNPAFVAWLASGRYNIAAPPIINSIWRYYLDEATDPAADPVEAQAVANAATRYLVNTRDTLGGRIDWTRIVPAFNGQATVNMTGINRRQSPGGPAAGPIARGARPNVGARRATRGWYWVNDAGQTGWVSFWWLDF